MNKQLPYQTADNSCTCESDRVLTIYMDGSQHGYNRRASINQWKTEIKTQN